MQYVFNDLGYLSEGEELFLVKSIWKPAYNSTTFYLSSCNDKQCEITVFNNKNDLDGLIEHLNEKPYDAFLRLKAYGLIK